MIDACLRSASALLFRIAEGLAPPKAQHWIAAIRAESQVLSDESSQLRWGGGLFTALRANIIDDHGRSISLAVVLGTSAAYVDLHTATRVPLQIILTVCALLVSLFGPSRAILAIPALLVGRSLLIICLGFPSRIPLIERMSFIASCQLPLERAPVSWVERSFFVFGTEVNPMWRDIKHAWRTLRQSRGFTC